MIEGLAAASIGVEPFPDLSSALECIRKEECAIVVLSQPEGWSLDRVAREIRFICGDDRAIVLSPYGSAFTPGIYVVSDQVPSEALGQLINRVVRMAWSVDQEN